VSDELRSAAIEACRAGAAVLRPYFRSLGLEVTTKAQNDFVTQADRESEAAVVAALHGRFPDHHVVGEESLAIAGGGQGEIQWLIDPLDGTTNFIQGLPIFCVSVGCRRGDQLLAAAIYDPIGENWWSAARGEGAHWNDRRVRVSSRAGLEGAFLATGYPFRARAALDAYLDAFRAVFLRARAVRRCGSAAIDLANAATGVYDGFFEFRLSPWDVAAGALLILEAGGRVIDLDGGGDWLARGNVLAGAPGVVDGLRDAISRHADEALLDRLVPVDPAVLRALDERAAASDGPPGDVSPGDVSPGDASPGDDSRA
jgi:myo-inositol-1(or 4)-monophosphatase